MGNETGRRIIQRGAEAVLCLEKAGPHCTLQPGMNKVLVKDRVRKGYRLAELDEKIRSQRTRHEESLLARAGRAGVSTPMVFSVGRNTIEMEFISGRKVKDAFNDIGDAERENVCWLIGEALGRLHGAGIMHGDFTTSNMILKEAEGKTVLYVIDFGLGKVTQKVEDHAVDLYLLQEALKAAHFMYLNDSWQKILKSYRQSYTHAGEVLKRLEKIGKRRRYKGE